MASKKNKKERRKFYPHLQGNAFFWHISIIFVAVFVFIACRFFVIMVLKHSDYQSQSVNQQTSDTAIKAVRGNILDCNGKILATSGIAYSVSLTPSNIKDTESAEKIARKLSETLHVNYDNIYNIALKDSKYASVADGISSDDANDIRSWARANGFSSAISLTETTKRYYPHDNVLSTVIGFVGKDNVGLEGIEYYYNDYLSGSDGKVIRTQNPFGTEMPFDYEETIDASDGYDITLTINLEMQYYLEKYIEEARVEHNVQDRICGVVMNVKTGEILAMTSKPDYNLNDPFVLTDEILLDSLVPYINEDGSKSDQYVELYNQYLKEVRRNKLVAEVYDPGSTYKIFTAAMALEENLVSLTETWNCSGHINMGAIEYYCANRKGHGTETLKDALANSCNPVFVLIAKRIGRENFYNYTTVFGFREKTGVGLPGELSGVHYPLEKFSEYNLYSSSFGQTFQVTGLQLIAAVCSVANGGTYMQPYIVKQISDKEGNIVVSNQPTELRKTCSEDTSKLLCEYLEYTVEKGKQGYMEGYHIAGKTGTSDKAENGSYASNEIIASFVCFAPADDPEICVLVIVDEPNSEVRYGSYIAAPLGKKIIVDCLDYLGIEPDTGVRTSNSVFVDVPDVKNVSISDAMAEITAAGLSVKVVGSGDGVLYQQPAKNKQLPVGGTVILYTDDTETDMYTEVPDLIGKTAADCNSILSAEYLNIDVIGTDLSYASTVAVSQDPEPGAYVSKATVVTVVFESSGDSNETQ